MTLETVHFILNCELLGNTGTPTSQDICIIRLNFDDRKKFKFRKQVRPETNTVNPYINYL